MVQDTYKRVQFYGKTADGGNNSYVTVPNHASLNMVDAFTVSARVYIDPDDKIMQGEEKGIVTKSTGAGAGGGFYFDYVDYAPYNRCFSITIFYNAGAAAVTCYTANTVKEKGWYHVTATFDRTLGANNINIYQNGVRVATANLAVAMDANVRNVLIGAITVASWMFKGYIAEAQVYNRALSESEINYAYLHPNNPKRRGLVLSLVQTSIDKPAAGTWKDVSPQTGNNGTITNATTSKYPAISAGRNALFFPTAARTDYVDCGNGASLNPATTGLISVETWVKAKALYAPLITVFATKWLGGAGWVFGFNAQLYFYVADTTVILATTDQNLSDRWLHIVATYTSGAATGKIYVNGIDKTSASAARALVNPAQNLWIGNSGGLAHAPVGGFISATRVYNRILTAEEVAYNYRHPNNPKRRGLVLNLSQESLYGAAPQWKDLSGNANHGTITGAIAKNIADSLTGD